MDFMVMKLSSSHETPSFSPYHVSKIDDIYHKTPIKTNVSLIYQVMYPAQMIMMLWDENIRYKS